ncbi:metalloregulator ArsR/SmtB family transcription factor [Mollicutes bacterium LVI A0039]|nr:metalloregulator ArsR/SmtB family transcription factor [Mollicutes bacterium LVI A0039]
MILNELKALANEKRLKVIYSLSNSDFCQMHIIELTKLSQVDASRSLKTLVDSGLVNSRKEGNRVVFSLSDKMINEYNVQLQQIKKEYNYLSFDVDIEQYIEECKTIIS